MTSFTLNDQFHSRKTKRPRQRRNLNRKKQTRVTRKSLGFSPETILRYTNVQANQQYTQYASGVWSYAMALTYVSNDQADYGRGSDLSPSLDACDLTIVMRQPVNYSFTYRFLIYEFLDKVSCADYTAWTPALLLEQTPISSNIFSVQEKLRRNQDPQFKVCLDRLMTWDTSSYVSENIRNFKLPVPAVNPTYNVGSASGATATRHQIFFVLTDALIQSNVTTISVSMYRTMHAEQ